MWNCKRQIVEQPVDRPLGSNNVTVRRVIWANSVSHVLPAIVIVRLVVVHSVHVFHAIVTNTPISVTRKLAVAFANTIPPAIRAINALRDSMGMRWVDRPTTVNGVRVRIMAPACKCQTIQSFAWNVRKAISVRLKIHHFDERTQF